MAVTFEEMLAGKRAAERKIREDFQAKWGEFFRCSGCSAICTPPPLELEQDEPDPFRLPLSQCCGLPARQHRYTAPPPIEIGTGKARGRKTPPLTEAQRIVVRDFFLRRIRSELFHADKPFGTDENEDDLQYCLRGTWPGRARKVTWERFLAYFDEVFGLPSEEEEDTDEDENEEDQ